MKSCFHLLVLASVCVLAGCGTPGAPQPPSLELPQTVQDLTATRAGNKVTLAWTPPRETTDHTAIRHLGPTLICRTTQTVAAVRCESVGQLPPAAPPPPNGKATKTEFTDTLPDNLITRDPDKRATYAVEVYNDRGRSAGLSNQVSISLAPTMPPPADVHATLTPQAVELRWSVQMPNRSIGAMKFEYHVLRRTEGQSNAVDLGAATETSICASRCGFYFLDRTFEWEKEYTYRVVGVTTVERAGGTETVPGEASAPLEVLVHDTFPPAQPGGVQAVASGVGQPPFIDLTWAPNADDDLAGYNVYRREEGQQPVKINSELVKAPAYRDAQVTAGHRYFYSVSAVDLRGNESTRSPEASETVAPANH